VKYARAHDSGRSNARCSVGLMTRLCARALCQRYHKRQRNDRMCSDHDHGTVTVLTMFG